MPKYTSHLFEGVKPKQVSKSFKDLSHEWKHDFSPGMYIPYMMIPVIPGDEIEIENQFFFKFSPLYFPVLHRMHLEADLFYIPYRIMWPEIIGDTDTGWANWIMLKNEVEHPVVDVNMEFGSPNTGNCSVLGYLGIPYIQTEEGRSTIITGLNAFPAMAYLHIYDNYYRNPNLEDPRAFPLVAGDNTTAMQQAYDWNGFTGMDERFAVFPAKWALDYFTAALPQPQVGDPVQIPMVNADYVSPGGTDYDGPWSLRRVGDLDPIAGALSANNVVDGGRIVDSAGNPVYLDTQTPAASIRELTLAEVLQGFRERLIKIGQRSKDYIKGMFGIDPNPMDIQIPVLFGSYRGIVNISEVLTQANTGGEIDISTGQYSGNMGLYEAEGQSFRYNVRDHGLILGIMTLLPNTGYGQGINRYWRYSTPYDYPMDIFTTVGDQEILKEEVAYTSYIADAAKNRETFGYIPKYAEASYIPNNFGSNLMINLGVGLSTHIGRWWDPDEIIGSEYDSKIALNRDFVTANPIIGHLTEDGGIRIGDVWRTLTFPNGETSANTIIGYVYNKVGAMRPLPMYSVPGGQV